MVSVQHCEHLKSLKQREISAAIPKHVEQGTVSPAHRQVLF